MVIEDQSEAIGGLHQTINYASKGIHIMSATLSDKVQYVYNIEKYSEYYASKLHHVGGKVVISDMYDLSLT